MRWKRVDVGISLPGDELQQLSFTSLAKHGVLGSDVPKEDTIALVKLRKDNSHFAVGCFMRNPLSCVVSNTG